MNFYARYNSRTREWRVYAEHTPPDNPVVKAHTVRKVALYRLGAEYEERVLTLLCRWALSLCGSEETGQFVTKTTLEKLEEATELLPKIQQRRK